MTTPTPTDDPVLKLLKELVARDDQTKETLGEFEKSLTDVKGSLARSEVQLRELRTEFQRQDQQLQAYDQRISGNYRGISAHLEVFGEEIRNTNRFIGNLEQAVVKLNRTSQVLHGRLIEESDIVGGRLGTLEADAAGLDTRVGAAEQGIRALERRVADALPSPGIGEAAGGG
jgi:chromosome segregation ATPase